MKKISDSSIVQNVGHGVEENIITSLKYLLLTDITQCYGRCTLLFYG